MVSVPVLAALAEVVAVTTPVTKLAPLGSEHTSLDALNLASFSMLAVQTPQELWKET